MKLACLDDDDRRRAKREQQLLWASIPVGLVLVTVAQSAAGEYAAFVPGLSGFVGYIVWGIVFSLGVWKGLGRTFPAERRFPYLAAHQLAASSAPSHDTSDYRTLAPPKEPVPEAPLPFVPASRHGAGLTKAYVGLTLFSMLAAVASWFVLVRGLKTTGPSDGADFEATLLTIAACIVAYLLASIVGLLWLHASWKAIPDQFRTTKDGRFITPHDAVVNMLIPFYNLYWIFYMHGVLCDAIDAQLVRLGSRRRAPKVLAMMAAAVHLVPWVNLALAPFFWCAYMLAADRAKAEMLALLRDEQNRMATAQPA